MIKTTKKRKTKEEPIVRSIDSLIASAKADLFTALKAYAVARDKQALLIALDADYMRIDRAGLYRHPQTGQVQAGMVIAINKDVRDRAMRKAALIDGKGYEVCEAYFALDQRCENVVDDVRKLILNLYRDIYDLPGKQLANILNF
jgi:hypothetical protein